MASPCQVLIDCDEKSHALQLAQLAQTEALRIEQKFSRYRDDNLIYKINHAMGKPVEVDTEIASLIDYANTCFDISGGYFDITSGILRKVWKFDCSDNIPNQSQITPLLDKIGWQKTNWTPPYFSLPEGMEIDFGGIGKEYAVDRSAQILSQATNESFLINYGGDIFVNKPRKDKQGWLVGVEKPDMVVLENNQTINGCDSTARLYELQRGGMATSGDSKRYLLKNGVRYSHILNPKTGWPVTKAPSSITVISNTCTEAGILATLAMLHEEDARDFLDKQDVNYWCV